MMGSFSGQELVRACREARLYFGSRGIFDDLLPTERGNCVGLV